MRAETYNKWTKPFRRHPKLLASVKGMNFILTNSCYILYPVLLIILFFQDQSLLIRCLLTSGISFVVISLVRKWINFPRPYEELEIDPLIVKNKSGSSFPSRHVFSVYMIAMCWQAFCPVVGGILLISGVLMAIVRVLGGVHYPRDVIAGALAGIGCGVLGLYII